MIDNSNSNYKVAQDDRPSNDGVRIKRNWYNSNLNFGSNPIATERFQEAFREQASQDSGPSSDEGQSMGVGSNFRTESQFYGNNPIQWNHYLDIEFHSLMNRIEFVVHQRKFTVSERFLDRQYNFRQFQKKDIPEKFAILDLIKKQIPLKGEWESENKGFEIHQLKNMLHSLNWRMTDPDFLDSFAVGEIIEVYDGNAVQIYRSWNFFQYCSYSLIDILSQDWGQLYERPRDVVQKLWDIFPKLFSKELSTIKYQNFGIATYLLIEKQIESEMGFYFTMNLASPIQDEFGNICAFVSTGSVTPIPLERETSASIYFI